MRWLLVTALLLSSAVAQAQGPADDDGEAPPGVTIEVHETRPPEGSLRRGYLTVPAWAFYVGAGALLLGAAGVLTVRLRRGGGR